MRSRHATHNVCQSQHHGLWIAPKRCLNDPSPPPPVQVVGTEVQAVELSPYTPYIDVEELGSFTLSRLFPTMLHSLLPFGIHAIGWQR
jgi:hypothetical protein